MYGTILWRFIVAAVFTATFGLASLAAIANEPPPLSAYGELRNVRHMAISPSGDGLAFVTMVKGQQVIVASGKDDKIRSVASIKGLKVRNLRWAGEDIVWLHISNTQTLGQAFTAKKSEFDRAVIFHPDSGKLELAFKNKRTVYDAIFGYYGTRTVKGRQSAFFGGLTLHRTNTSREYGMNHGRPALYRLDLKKNSPTKIAKAPPEKFWRNWLVNKDGNISALLDINKKTGAWDIRTPDNSVLAAGTNALGMVDLVSFGKTSDTVIYRTQDELTGNINWFEVPLAGGTSNQILQGLPIDELITHAENGTMLGYHSSIVSRAPLTFFDPEHQPHVEKLMAAFPDHALTIVDWTPDFRHFIVQRAGNKDSGTLFRVDMAELSAVPIGHERPLILPQHVGPISIFDYTAADGLEMDGILTLPPGRTPENLPVIMMPHGGPNSASHYTFSWWAQAFASRGYAVFQPNFRGSTNRGAAFQEAGNGQWGRKMQTDISDGLSALVAQGIVNPDRACIMGASYGGYAALAGVTLQQGLYRCAVAVAPVSDMRQHFDRVNRETLHNKIIKKQLAKTMGDPALYDAVSPRRLAARADAPILLIHGKDDTVVQFAHSENMADALKRAGKPFELVVLPEEDHWLSKSPTRKIMLEAAMQFIQTHNPAD